MFIEINMSNYVIEFDLQKAYFLRDCLYEEISYELKGSNVIIYKKLNGISEEITLDELIFYIHTGVAHEINKYLKNPTILQHGHPNSLSYYPKCPPQTYFWEFFKDIDTIKKAVENMKLILKYDNDKSDEEDILSSIKGEVSKLKFR